jgi:hypothetical protein
MSMVFTMLTRCPPLTAETPVILSVTLPVDPVSAESVWYTQVLPTATGNGTEADVVVPAGAEDVVVRSVPGVLLAPEAGPPGAPEDACGAELPPQPASAKAAVAATSAAVQPTLTWGELCLFMG